MSTSDRIKKIRGQLDRAEFGAKIGVSDRTVQRWELSQDLPKGKDLVKISEVFNINTHWLLTGTGRPYIQKPGDAYTASQKPGDVYSSAQNNIDTTPPQNTRPETAQWKISEKITRAADILESDTIYKDALAANIDAFHQAMTAEHRLSEMENNMKEIQEKFTDFEQRFKALEEENSRLRQKLRTRGDAGAKAVNQD